METRYLAGWKTEIWMTIEYFMWILIQISPKTRALDEYLAANTTAWQLVSSLPLKLAHKPPGVKHPNFYLHINKETQRPAASTGSTMSVAVLAYRRERTRRSVRCQSTPFAVLLVIYMLMRSLFGETLDRANGESIASPFFFIYIMVAR